MELTKETIAKIEAYCRKNIRHYEEKCKIALDEMDMMRCSLSFAYGSLNDAIFEYSEEWIRDNMDNITEEQIERIMDNFNAEDILFYTED